MSFWIDATWSNLVILVSGLFYVGAYVTSGPGWGSDCLYPRLAHEKAIVKGARKVPRSGVIDARIIKCRDNAL